MAEMSERNRMVQMIQERDARIEQLTRALRAMLTSYDASPPQSDKAKHAEHLARDALNPPQFKSQ